MADAGGLNPPEARASYGFESRPGHSVCAGEGVWAGLCRSAVRSFNGPEYPLCHSLSRVSHVDIKLEPASKIDMESINNVVSDFVERAFGVDDQIDQA